VPTARSLDLAPGPSGVPLHVLNHRSLWSLDALSRRDVHNLAASARTLERAAQAGAPCRALRGKNIARLGEQPADAAGEAFDRAATELGAQVTHIRPGESGLVRGGDVGRTARMLGKLYDAIDCRGLPPELVLGLEHEAGVPVFNGLAGGDHPTRALLDLLALQGLGGRPLAELSVCFTGSVPSARERALRQAAELADVELHLAGDGMPPADFLLGDDDVVRSAGGDSVDRARVATSLRHVLQALLVGTLG
jgi:ornithine carbamoyltransferase